MPCPIPFYAFIIIICMPIIFVTYASDHDKQHFTDCAPFKCGNISEIRYPFRLLGGSDYCGHPGFEVECAQSFGPDADLFMTMKSMKYKVNSIAWEKQRLNIARLDLYYLCPKGFINTNIDHSLFEYASGSENATLYYDCEETWNEDPHRFTCDNWDDTRDGYLFFDKPELHSKQLNLSKYCNYSFTVPLRETAAPQPPSPMLMHSYIVAAIRKGFDVTWKVDTQQCRSCNISGGRCGHDATTQEFKCFRPEGSKVHQKIVIGVGVGVGGLVLVGATFFFLYHHQNRRKYTPTSFNPRSFSYAYSDRMDCETDGCYGLPIFDYEELREATNDFDQKNKVGDGGFGTIYKGKLRDGRVVAIKRLYENNNNIKEQFLNEVQILARLRHPNLVVLYGCTSPYSKRLLLVYEFITDGTVADHLYGDRAKLVSLSWSTRLNIAIKTATALLYLHRSDVIHRDVKTNNILLNDNFSVKVADFGLSRLFPLNVTHVLTAPQGTPGYVDPEYHQCYQLTEKSDVYSFGVVLMELISSLPAVDLKRHGHEIHLSTMGINKIQSGELYELVDKHLGFDCNDNIQKMISAVAELAFLCLQHAKEMRPCMEEVLETLESIQMLDKPTNKATELDSLPDDEMLLKSKLIRSPDSIMVKLDSTLTTPNASS